MAGSGDENLKGKVQSAGHRTDAPFANIYDDQRRAAAYATLAFHGTYHLAYRDLPEILLGSTPDIYVHEWASFTTHQFAENRVAKSGSAVRIVMKDVDDQRPVVDIVWSHVDYLDLFGASDRELIAQHQPLGRQDEPYAWLTETAIAPWVIYVVTRRSSVR